MPFNLPKLAKELRTAAANGDLALVRQCLTLENVNLAGPKSGKSALHFAAQNGHRDIVALLIKQGAQVNQQEQNLETPLLLAIANQHYPIAEQLLSAGCTVGNTDKNGLNALQLALSQRAPAELLLRLRAQLIAELNPSQHLKKNGSVQTLPQNFADEIQTSIKQQLTLSQLPLSPIIFNIYDHHDYWYGFINEQLPALKRLGYQALGMDENVNQFDQTNGLTFYQIGYNRQQLLDAFYHKNLPKILNIQLREHTAKHAGDIIYVLHATDRSLSLSLEKLCAIPFSLVQCGEEDDISQALTHLAISEQSRYMLLQKGKACEEQFWKTLANHFRHERNVATYCSTTAQTPLNARLQRIHEAFDVMIDRQRTPHGIVPVDKVTHYLDLAQKVERKLQITPLLQHVNNKQSLVVPKLTQAKTKENSAFFELNAQRKALFKMILEQWLRYLTPSPLKLQLPPDIGLRKITLSLPVGEEIFLD